jgi:hypothetical protein
MTEPQNPNHPQVTDLPADTMPDVWVDHETWFEDLTPDELALGQSLGQVIDTDEDTDSGHLLTGVASLLAATTVDVVHQKAIDFRACLLDHGVPEVSIELQIGRPVVGDRWDAVHPVTNFGHHTVSRYLSSRLTPCLGIIKTGRIDVPGPLCNGYGGWDLTARLITFGLANHPGAGGPLVVNGFRIPQDSARPYSWGWEFEGGLDSADWDRVLKNPRGRGRAMTFREFMARCGAATQDYFGLPGDAHIEHKTWAPTRKVDRLGYDAARGRAEIARWSDTLSGEGGSTGRDTTMSTTALNMAALGKPLSDTWLFDAKQLMAFAYKGIKVIPWTTWTAWRIAPNMAPFSPRKAQLFAYTLRCIQARARIKQTGIFDAATAAFVRRYGYTITK